MGGFISRNVKYGAPLKLSPWRKIAIGTWKTAGDPSIYATVEFDAEPALKYIERLRKETGEKITFTHFVGKAMGNTFKIHPQVNCLQRWGRLYPRTAVDLFFQVATDDEGKDLSGLTIRNVPDKSLTEIAVEMRERTQKIRNLTDQSFSKMKGLFGLLPGWLAATLLNVSGFLMYGLNIYSKAMGVPRDTFGSGMITSIGSLGLEMAFAPLVPYCRIPVIIAVGAIQEKPIVKDGKIVIGKRVNLCATFDHRVIDGIHGAHMTNTLKKILGDPEKYL